MLKSNRKRETPVVTIYNNLYFYRNLTAHKTYQKYKLIAIFVWAIYFKIVHMYRNKYCLVGSVSQYFYIFYFYFWQKEEMCLFISDPQNTSFSSFTETWVSFLSILFGGIRTTTTLAPTCMYFRFNATSRCNGFLSLFFHRALYAQQ